MQTVNELFAEYQNVINWIEQNFYEDGVVYCGEMSPISELEEVILKIQNSLNAKELAIDFIKNAAQDVIGGKGTGVLIDKHSVDISNVQNDYRWAIEELNR